jgi:hypothetical protein
MSSQPIDEEEWKKMQEKKTIDEVNNGSVSGAEEDEGIIASGGLLVVLPVALVGGVFAFWAIGSENAWF